MNITNDELRSAGFHRAGTVSPDSSNAVRVEISLDVPGHVVYMMTVNSEVKKFGITGYGSLGLSAAHAIHIQRPTQCHYRPRPESATGSVEVSQAGPI